MPVRGREVVDGGGWEGDGPRHVDVGDDVAGDDVEHVGVMPDAVGDGDRDLGRRLQRRDLGDEDGLSEG